MSLSDMFARQGYVGPLRAIPPHEAASAASDLRASLREDNYSAHARRNRHFDLSSVRQAATSPALLETVRAVYSHNLLLWRSHVFTGRPGRGLGWHSDRFATLLADPNDHLTVHLALTEAPRDNCMMVIPGSHLWDESERRDAGFSLIESTAQTGYGTPYYKRTSKQNPPTKIPLQPGEFFVFHPATLHASVDRMSSAVADSSLLALAKRTVKAGLRRFEGKGIVSDPPRMAIGLRFCDPRNAVRPAAFEEMAGRGAGPACVSGEILPPGSSDWRARR